MRAKIDHDDNTLSTDAEIINETLHSLIDVLADIKIEMEDIRESLVTIASETERNGDRMRYEHLQKFGRNS